jgi:hypothetical protein
MSTTADVRAARGKIAAAAVSIARQTLARAAREGKREVTVTLPTEDTLALTLSEFADFIGEYVADARASITDDNSLVEQQRLLAEMRSLVIE